MVCFLAVTVKTDFETMTAKSANINKQELVRIRFHQSAKGSASTQLMRSPRQGPPHQGGHSRHELVN
jgi:hypothetical protein